MPDIAMCVNKDCPFRHKCYRFMAVPDTHQSYMVIFPNTDGTCDQFLPLNSDGRAFKGEEDGR
jgi:hypothetical protein